jgi:hypothetical protein
MTSVMSPTLEPHRVNLGVNTFTAGANNRYFLFVKKHGVEHCRDIHHDQVKELHEITHMGEYDWGQRIDYVATCLIDVFAEVWYRNVGDCP